MIPVFINDVFIEAVRYNGEEHHVSFWGYSDVICKRIWFVLNGHKLSLFFGEMDKEVFKNYI